MSQIDKSSTHSRGAYMTLVLISIGVTLMVSVSAYFVYLREKKQTEKELLVEGERNLERLMQFIDKEYETVSQDLAFLSRNPAFSSYLEDEPIIQRQAIEKALLAYGEIRGSYTKIRLIDTTGVERLKLDYKNNTATLNSELQYKGDRYYFEGSRKLKYGEIYISYFDLNMEFGEYSKPYQPVLRFSTPFRNRDNKIVGYVVLSFDGKSIINFSHQLETREQLEIYLLTSKGGYMKGQYPEWDWGFLFETDDRSFQGSYPDLWKNITDYKDAALVSENIGLVAFRRFVPSNFLSNKMPVVREEDNYWYLLCVHPAEVVSEFMFGIRRDLTLYALIVLGTILPIIAALFRNLIHKNDELNLTLVKLEKSNADLMESQSELHQNLSQMKELTQEKEEAIEELEIKERELTIAKNSAEQATKAKTNFLATMSHEIRTPMNAVLGMADLLKRTRLSDEQNELVKTIQLSGDALLTVINDILDFSRIQSGKMTIDSHPFELEKVVVDAFRIVENRIQGKAMEMIYTIDNSLPRVAISDESRIRQVLLNLLSNAAKFTDEGFIAVRVLANPEQKGLKGNILFQVEDSGMGIPPEKQNLLFQPFNQLDSSITRKHGGSGLGLAISRTIVEQMGGEIQVESKSGKGSVFSFSVEVGFPNADVSFNETELEGQKIMFLGLHPYQSEALEKLVLSRGASIVREGDRETPEVLVCDFLRSKGGMVELGQSQNIMLNVPRSLMQETPTEQIHWIYTPVDQRMLIKALTGKMPQVNYQDQDSAGAKESIEQGDIRILLAEDNLVNQRLANMLLGRMGYECDAVENGLEAVNAVQNRPYDLVLMDIQMPELDGLEATRRIRAKFGRQHIIIALTANAMEGDREHYLREGMDDYMSKPIRFDALQSKLNFWLQEIRNRNSN
jgi:signal transduction histidine kinase/ActR/RegA family two-component response regulator